MDGLKNQLPVAVHQVGGGEARVRKSSTVIHLQGLTSGSFSTENATKIRIQANLLESADATVLVSYDGDPSFANAEYVFDYTKPYIECIAGPLTVYWHLMDSMTGTNRVGGTNDYLYVTFYE
jgi:hypothetical protein